MTIFEKWTSLNSNETFLENWMSFTTPLGDKFLNSQTSRDFSHSIGSQQTQWVFNKVQLLIEKILAIY